MLDFVAIDFETANERPESACALGLVDVKNGEIVEVKSWLIRPPEAFGHFRDRNRRLHGLSEDDVLNAHDFRTLWPTISGYLNNRVVVAHSVGTDISILRGLLEHFQLVPPEFRYSCTLRIAQSAWPNKAGGYKLSEVAKHVGFSFDHHKPDEDAKACAAVAISACRAQGVDCLVELSKVLGTEIVQFSMEKVTHYESSVVGVEIVWRIDSDEFDLNEETQTREKSQGFTTEAIKLRCSDDGAFARGLELFKKNKFTVTSQMGTKLLACVAGSGKKPYEVLIGRTLDGQCSCPAWINSSTRFCKHVVAAALAWEALGGPTPVDDLTKDEKIAACEDRIQSMPTAMMRETLLLIARAQPELLCQILGD